MSPFNFGRRGKNQPGKKLTALHIDDSRWIRIPVSILLRRHFGMRVLEASGGEEGLRLAVSEQPDVIILDVMMPMMDGYETLVQLKRDERTREIPVLMCTARDLTREVNLALRLGALGYLTKPIEEDMLVKKVRELLEATGKWGTISKISLEPKRSEFDQAVEVVVPPGDTTLRDTASPPASNPAERKGRPCPLCQTALNYISQYEAWYCYPCRKYPDHDA